ncbi:MAG TPA: recombinase RecA [Persephonella sp.]|uniref:Protein RecA n=1 Tax=Persephonella marina (strain DSM 14350 / EX-H1) TaxID=123214 RepID=C0QST0_PERMH|nr:MULTISPECIES: recombinase RecA [Persephonella]ACO03129.1 protein RecA [Persephonella marina EX-H1]HCB70636.1 recombinase RecA [Persephonella sp.]
MSEVLDQKELQAKKKALESALAQIEKKFGKGSIMTLSSEAEKTVDVIPSGSLTLDIATGIGGVPKGRVVEIYGPESSGKTTLTLHIIAEAQKRGGKAVFIDAEHAFDPKYAKAIGVNLEDLIISQPDYGEQALEIAETLIRSGVIDVIIIDSVAALVPKAELEGDIEDSNVGLHARLMSKAMRVLKGAVNKSNTSLILINQIREKVGVMFGNPETTTGGRAIKFFADMRLEVRKKDIKDSGEKVGSRVKVKVVKNKLAPPFKEAEFDVIYGEGISKEGELLDLGEEIGIIKKSGAWYSYGDSKIGQGREKAREFLKQNPDIAQEIENRIREEFLKTSQ